MSKTVSASRQTNYCSRQHPLSIATASNTPAFLLCRPCPALPNHYRDAEGDTVKKLIEEMAQPVIDMLNLLFGHLTYDCKPMNVGENATTDSIAAMMEQLKVFSDDYNFGKPDRGLVFKLPLFKELAA
jgi:hypothetical protein